MENILNELFYGNIHPMEQIPYTKPMKEVTKCISKHRDALSEKLDDQGKEALEKLVDNLYEYCSLLSCETFLYAIKLGANLMIALTQKGDTDE